MLIKAADDKTKRLKLLAELQKSDRLDDRQRDWLHQELRRFAPGLAGERDAAHYLDMSFSDSKNHAVLHDLRFEAGGQTAQIDHLVVDRMLTFFLLETKTYRGNLHINDHGEFMVEYSGERRYGIESPLEQSRRHETVLKKVLERLGITGRAGTKPTFVHIVMVHPKGIIYRSDPKAFDSSMVIKADQFSTWHKTFVDKIGAGIVIAGLLNARSRNTVKEWGEQLKAEHRPTNPLELPDFMKPKPLSDAISANSPLPGVAGTVSQKNKMPGAASSLPQERKLSHSAPSMAAESVPRVCKTCGKKLSPKVVKYCTDMSNRFGGEFYCYDHQTGAN